MFLQGERRRNQSIIQWFLQHSLLYLWLYKYTTPGYILSCQNEWLTAWFETADDCDDWYDWYEYTLYSYGTGLYNTWNVLCLWSFYKVTALHFSICCSLTGMQFEWQELESEVV